MPSIAQFNVYAVLILQVVWWLSVIIVLASMLIKASSKRNYLFLFILSFLFTLNMLYLMLLLKNQMQLALAMVDTAVLVISLLVGVVAGRVLPFLPPKGWAYLSRYAHQT
nr:NnrS family protein [Ningiella sp. W23]